MGKSNKFIEIAAGGSLSEARKLLRAVKEAGYEVAILRRFTLSAEELSMLQQEFTNPLRLLVLPDFHAKKSLYFARDVKAGELLTKDGIIEDFPLRGVTKEALPKVLNKRACYDAKKGDPITLGVVEL